MTPACWEQHSLTVDHLTDIAVGHRHPPRSGWRPREVEQRDDGWCQLKQRRVARWPHPQRGALRCPRRIWAAVDIWMMGKSRERAAGWEERRRRRWTGRDKLRPTICLLTCGPAAAVPFPRDFYSERAWSVAILSQSTCPTAACTTHILQEQIMLKK
jgi:hypothetical protein